MAGGEGRGGECDGLTDRHGSVWLGGGGGGGGGGRGGGWRGETMAKQSWIFDQLPSLSRY